MSIFHLNNWISQVRENSDCKISWETCLKLFRLIQVHQKYVYLITRQFRKSIVCNWKLLVVWSLLIIFKNRRKKLRKNSKVTKKLQLKKNTNPLWIGNIYYVDIVVFSGETTYISMLRLRCCSSCTNPEAL